MKVLERIDRIKMQLQAAKQALHEADNWTVLATDLEEVSNEYMKGLREKNVICNLTWYRNASHDISIC
jgi:hypothetical protein